MTMKSISLLGASVLASAAAAAAATVPSASEFAILNKGIQSNRSLRGSAKRQRGIEKKKAERNSGTKEGRKGHGGERKSPRVKRDNPTEAEEFANHHHASVPPQPAPALDADPGGWLPTPSPVQAVGPAPETTTTTVAAEVAPDATGPAQTTPASPAEEVEAAPPATVTVADDMPLPACPEAYDPTHASYEAGDIVEMKSHSFVCQDGPYETYCGISEGNESWSETEKELWMGAWAFVEPCAFAAETLEELLEEEAEEVEEQAEEEAEEEAEAETEEAEEEAQEAATDPTTTEPPATTTTEVTTEAPDTTSSTATPEENTTEAPAATTTTIETPDTITSPATPGATTTEASTTTSEASTTTTTTTTTTTATEATTTSTTTEAVTAASTVEESSGDEPYPTAYPTYWPTEMPPLCPPVWASSVTYGPGDETSVNGGYIFVCSEEPEVAQFCNVPDWDDDLVGEGQDAEEVRSMWDAAWTYVGPCLEEEELDEPVEANGADIVTMEVVQLSDDCEMKYRVDADEGLLVVEIVHDGESWLGLAFSEDGSMVGSEAVIGLPDEGTVLKYDLGGKYTAAVTPMADSRQTLSNASIEIVDGQTILKFTKLMTEQDEIPIVRGANVVLYAHGRGTELGYHGSSGRMALELDL